MLGRKKKEQALMLTVGLVVGALVVGGILGYAFRGKESAALSSMKAEGIKLAGDVRRKL